MGKEPFFLSREALYIKIWETPTTKLAKEFGMSDVALGKICRRLEIPKPPPGCWRRIETGHRKKIPPLGKPNDKTSAGIWIYPKSEERTLNFEEEYKKQSQSLTIEQNIADKAAAEALPQNKIKVSGSLYKPHPLVAQTKSALAKGDTDRYGAVYGSWYEKSLNIHVSKKNLNRALRIMDALIKALEKRGCKVSVTERDRSKVTAIQVEEIEITVALNEKLKRLERDASKEQKPNSYNSSRYYYEATGNFTLIIDSGGNAKNAWSDGETSTLEDQLNKVIVGIFRVAEERRQKEIERKNEKRREIENAIEQEKVKIRRAKENVCREKLEELSSRWQKSLDLYRFLQAYEAEIIEQKGEISPESLEAEFLEWGYNHVGRINPLLNNQLNELLEQFKRRNGEPVENDSHELSNLLWKLKFL